METLTFLLTSSFYPPFHVGGDAVHVSYLADELAARGHEVHVLYSLDAYRLKERKPRPGHWVNEKITLHPIVTPLSLSAYAAYLIGSSHAVTKSYRALLEEVKPDVVHHHNISLLGHNLLDKRGNYLNLYTAHDYWLICPQGNLLRNKSRVCDTASCMLCGLSYGRPPQVWRYCGGFEKSIHEIDCLIAPSDYLKRRMMGKLPLKGVTIPNFAPNPPNDIRSSEYSGFFLYAGVLEMHKGVIQLLEEYRDFAEQTNMKLIIVGQGSLRPEIESFIKKYGLSHRVYLLGWVNRDSLWAMLQDATALVIPSIWPENSPLIALEALSVQTPVIGSNRGGLPEIVRRLNDGLVFSWELKDDFRRAVRFCLDNIEEMRNRAREIYTERFSPAAYLKSYEKLLQPS